jgi:hypothetical protein
MNTLIHQPMPLLTSCLTPYFGGHPQLDILLTSHIRLLECPSISVRLSIRAHSWLDGPQCSNALEPTPPLVPAPPRRPLSQWKCSALQPALRVRDIQTNNPQLTPVSAAPHYHSLEGFLVSAAHLRTTGILEARCVFDVPVVPYLLAPGQAYPV